MATICEWFGLKTTRTVFSDLTSKPVVTVSSDLASKHAATVSAGYASKPVATVSGGLASKPAATVSGGLASKHAVTVSRFGHQNRRLWFGDLGLKITTTVSWFGPQNQAGFSLSVAAQNQRRDVGVGHTSRYSGLLRVEASRAMISQSGLKTGGGATAGGAHGIITEVASSGS
jgi:hypothetical protein